MYFNENSTKKFRHNPGNVPPIPKSEDSFFCKTNKTHGMKFNITIVSMYNNVS